MVVEIAGDQMYFDTISRTGDVVDSGTVSATGPTTSLLHAAPAQARPSPLAP